MKAKSGEASRRRRLRAEINLDRFIEACLSAPRIMRVWESASGRRLRLKSYDHFVLSTLMNSRAFAELRQEVEAAGEPFEYIAWIVLHGFPACPMLPAKDRERVLNAFHSLAQLTEWPLLPDALKVMRDILVDFLELVVRAEFSQEANAGFRALLTEKKRNFDMVPPDFAKETIAILIKELQRIVGRPCYKEIAAMFSVVYPWAFAPPRTTRALQNYAAQARGSVDEIRRELQDRF